MEFLGEVRVPVARRQAPLLPILPVCVCFEFPDDLKMGQSIALSESSESTGQVDANDDAADIKDHGARRLFNGGTKKRHG